jgi:hypothetical protein
MAPSKRLFLLVVLTLFITTTPLLAQASGPDEVRLTVIEHVFKEGKGHTQVNTIPPVDDSATNPDYKLLSYHWYITAKYWVNPSNKYGFSNSDVVTAIKASANAWDAETGATVFSWQGTISKNAGKRDGYNVVAWGHYRAGVIAVTYIWYSGSQILETDILLNTFYKWSLSGESGKMDIKNIMTHEFGHWAGLADLYNDKDYWLTMYGYSDYGETYKRTLGLGDTNGLEYRYGP